MSRRIRWIPRVEKYSGHRTDAFHVGSGTRLAVAGERRPRAHLDSVLKAVWSLEKISVRNLAMHLM